MAHISVRRLIDAALRSPAAEDVPDEFYRTLPVLALERLDRPLLFGFAPTQGRLPGGRNLVLLPVAQMVVPLDGSPSTLMRLKPNDLSLATLPGGMALGSLDDLGRHPYEVRDRWKAEFYDAFDAALAEPQMFDDPETKPARAARMRLGRAFAAISEAALAPFYQRIAPRFMNWLIQ